VFFLFESRDFFFRAKKKRLTSVVAGERERGPRPSVVAGERESEGLGPR